MNRTRRRLQIVTAGVVVAAWAALYVVVITTAPLNYDPATESAAKVNREFALLLAVPTALWVTAALLLVDHWWRQAGASLAGLDGPARLLAAATATLPADRRHWGAAMTAELAQVQDPRARWRFAAGCARAALFPPGGNRAAVGATGALAVAALAATVLATGAALPAGRVFALTFIGLLGGLATLGAARSRRVRPAGPGPAIAGLALAGVVACLAFTIYYLAEHPTYYNDGLTVSLPPLTAVALAVTLAGCLGLALRPPRWLLADRPGRWLGIAMAIVLVGGSLLVTLAFQLGLMGYLLVAALLVVLPGSAVAAAVGRSFRSGLWACAWAVVLATPLLIATWLAEGLHWYQAGWGAVLDGEGLIGVGVNLGDAVWWDLTHLILWTLPLGVLGAAAGSWLAHHRRSRQQAGLGSAP
jgi:hypothetical protein